MRTFKFLLALCIAALFAAAPVNAQTERITFSTVWHLENVWLDGENGCVGETVTGDIEYHTFTMWQEGRAWSKWQDRYTGTLTGDITGSIYILNEVDQEHNVWNQNAGNFNFNAHWNIIRKGYGPVGTAHIRVHGTANDAIWIKRAEFVCWVEVQRFECR